MAVDRARSKGTEALTLVVYAVVGVAVVVFLFSVLGMGQQIADYIQKIIFGQLSSKALNTDLRDAIECSYLRCTEGCGATAGISVRFPFGMINCKEHCESAVAAEGITDGKLCGEAAKKHPLMVRISEQDTYISTDELAFTSACKDENTCCLVPSEKGTETGWGMAALIKDTLVKKADIGADNCPITHPPTSARFEKCSEDATGNCGADTITLNADMYYVWAEKRSFGTATIVWDSYTEPIESASFVCCSNSWRSGLACTKGTLRDARFCDSSADSGTEACSNKCTAEGYPQSFYGTQRNDGDYMVCTCMDTGAAAAGTTTTTIRVLPWVWKWW